jgi:hypothetical protein
MPARRWIHRAAYRRDQVAREALDDDPSPFYDPSVHRYFRSKCEGGVLINWRDLEVRSMVERAAPAATQAELIAVATPPAHRRQEL